jgi:hypothetical protein
VGQIIGQTLLVSAHTGTASAMASRCDESARDGFMTAPVTGRSARLC